MLIYHHYTTLCYVMLPLHLHLFAFCINININININIILHYTDWQHTQWNVVTQWIVPRCWLRTVSHSAGFCSISAGEINHEWWPEYTLCKHTDTHRQLSFTSSTITIWSITKLLPLVLWHCWLGDRKDIRPVKTWILVCCWWWVDWSFARLIASVVSHHLRHPQLQ